MLPYVELRARSAFSFLEGASLPEALAEQAAECGMPAMALTDRAGLYGAPRFHAAMCRLGLRAIVGAEIPLEGGARLPVLAETRTGYRNLCRLLSRLHLRAPKGEGTCRLEEVEAFAPGLVCLTGSDEGPLTPALGTDNAAAMLERLTAWFGRENVFIEISRHHHVAQERRTRRFLELAATARLPVVATNGVAYATPEEKPIADVFTCLRHHVRLDTAGRRLGANAERCLKPPAEMAQLFRDLPGAVARAGELGERLGFQLTDLGYEFPRAPVPAGETMTSHLRALVETGHAWRYSGRGRLAAQARRQIERELALIARLQLEGYFLIVHDIAQFCREEGILAQGRGSAANSAVCFCLGITAVDPVGMELLFERFLSEERGEWPDVDIDLPSGKLRERVIQHLYARYGAQGAAMTANVITYRGRSAAREVGKVLDFPEEMVTRIMHTIAGAAPPESEDIEAHGGAPPGWDPLPPAERPSTEEALRCAGFDIAHPRLQRFLHLCRALQDLPRHLGQHSGGMVLCRGRLDEVVPLENATMPGRVVVQWDKDDCADLGLIKVDLLGLGMMAALQDALRLLHPDAPAGARETLDLAQFPPDDPAVYRMLQAADTIGVFQVESRAQISTLPRMRPERFYDLVVEVGLIRPGPVAGKMVNPYLERRAGRQEVTYPHPSLEPILKRTLGVPLFQEQLLRMAMAAAGFTGGEAEELRRAFGFKRAAARMSAVETRLRAGMAARGITGEAADTIVRFVTSFALYGFPESHAASFALLVYASAYLKAHHPAEFYVTLLNNQPMGFYSPSTLVQDACRHGVAVLPIAVAHSDWDCTIVTASPPVIRLGLRYVNGLRQESGRQTAAERRRAPFTSLDDLRRRSGINRSEARLLAELGALELDPKKEADTGRARVVPAVGARSQGQTRDIRNGRSLPSSDFREGARREQREAAANEGEERIRKYETSLSERERSDAMHIAPHRSSRRGALWQVERAWRPLGELYEVDASEAAASPLPEMDAGERMLADYRNAGLTLGPHPLALRREELQRQGVRTAAEIRSLPHGRRVKVAGLVLARQRPGTAKGIVFMSLEDESGIANIIVPSRTFEAQRWVCVSEGALWIEGVLQNRDGVVHVKAERILPVPREMPTPSADSRDFH